ncbi:hypothetical protein PR048_020661 [Dryococelus australis]|uniref:Uncharacterized protein n=1 Tax=Dryococelus australis TaxID=614101 RepID=A0ABQ9H6U9_9NEOP|nr:hypothetical protein PR048_020661 [Dryococelus australis]
MEVGGRNGETVTHDRSISGVDLKGGRGERPAVSIGRRPDARWSRAGGVVTGAAAPALRSPATRESALGRRVARCVCVCGHVRCACVAVRAFRRPGDVWRDVASPALHTSLAPPAMDCNEVTNPTRRNNETSVETDSHPPSSVRREEDVSRALGGRAHLRPTPRIRIVSEHIPEVRYQQTSIIIPGNNAIDLSPHCFLEQNKDTRNDVIFIVIGYSRFAPVNPYIVSIHGTVGSLLNQYNAACTAADVSHWSIREVPCTPSRATPLPRTSVHRQPQKFNPPVVRRAREVIGLSGTSCTHGGMPLKISTLFSGGPIVLATSLTRPNALGFLYLEPRKNTGVRHSCEYLIREELEARYRAASETIENTPTISNDVSATCCNAAVHASNAEETILSSCCTLSSPVGAARAGKIRSRRLSGGGISVTSKLAASLISFFTHAAYTCSIDFRPMSEECSELLTSSPSATRRLDYKNCIRPPSRQFRVGVAEWMTGGIPSEETWLEPGLLDQELFYLCNTFIIGPFFFLHAPGNSAPVNEHFTIVCPNHVQVTQKGSDVTYMRQTMEKQRRLDTYAVCLASPRNTQAACVPFPVRNATHSRVYCSCVVVQVNCEASTLLCSLLLLGPSARLEFVEPSRWTLTVFKCDGSRGRQFIVGMAEWMTGGIPRERRGQLWEEGRQRLRTSIPYELGYAPQASSSKCNSILRDVETDFPPLHDCPQMSVVRGDW